MEFHILPTMFLTPSHAFCQSPVNTPVKKSINPVNVPIKPLNRSIIIDIVSVKFLTIVSNAGKIVGKTLLINHSIKGCKTPFQNELSASPIALNKSPTLEIAGLIWSCTNDVNFSVNDEKIGLIMLL